MDWKSKEITDLIRRTLEEDIGSGDVTTDFLIPEDTACTASIQVKEKGVIAGLPLIPLIYRELDPGISFTPLVQDGEEADGPKEIARLEGPAAGILRGERVTLNFLQRLSGIATLTREFVKRVEGTGVKILDTRKTTPGLRVLEKYAVKTGGGNNYRFGLYDMIMIKDNHIIASGGIKKAVEKAVAKNEKGLMVVIEVRNLEEVKEAVICPVDRIMLDNMPLNEMKEAVGIVGGRVALEASGNMTLDGIREAAETGVDFISVGALTNRFRALDIGLDVIQKKRA